MILLYRVLTKLIYPIIIIVVFIRIIFKKEDPKRYKEKIFSSHFNVIKNHNRKLVWFHAASIGELKSVVPIIQKINSSNLNFDFLVTTTTLSSSSIARAEFKEFKNVYHRFLPFDLEFLMSRFVKLWSPSYIFLVDSEIWPNLILLSKKNKIPLAIINARITLKSFNRWKKFPKTAAKIFSSFDLCLASSLETKKFLEKLNAKNIHLNGNIKFINKLNHRDADNQNENILLNKRFWIAASTHPTEEELCLKTHRFLKKKYQNILTIIAPRHIERSKSIGFLCKKYNLNFQILNQSQNILSSSEVIIINSFGILQKYFNYAKSVFLGKSTIKKLENDSGQNPLEAAKLGCKVYHGPFVNNFKDIYEILGKNNISIKIKDHEELGKNLTKDLEDIKKNRKISKVLDELSIKISTNTFNHIKNFLKNEIQ